MFFRSKKLDSVLETYRLARIKASESQTTFSLPESQKDFSGVVLQAFADAGAEPPKIQFLEDHNPGVELEDRKAVNKATKILSVVAMVGVAAAAYTLSVDTSDNTASNNTVYTNTIYPKVKEPMSDFKNQSGGTDSGNSNIYRANDVWCDSIYHRNVSCELRPLVDELRIEPWDLEDPQDEISLEEFIQSQGNLGVQKVPEDTLNKILRPQKVIDEDIADHEAWCDSIDHRNVGCPNN